MPYFYHYTDEKGAKNIVRTGRIMASLKFVARGDVAHGNGVYLTMLSPDTASKEEVAMNNWMKKSPEYINKTKNYFVIEIPNSDIEAAKDTDRNIFLFGKNSDLRLEKYSWWLRDFDSGQIIGSYKYQLTSLGPASSEYPYLMGDYAITVDTVNGRPVYKNWEGSTPYFLFMDSKSRWAVGPDAGDDHVELVQRSLLKNGKRVRFSIGPDADMPWKNFANVGGWKVTDASLRALPWQK